MRTSNKIIVLYLSAMVIISTICLIDNYTRSKKLDPLARELLNKAKNQKIDVVYMNSLMDKTKLGVGITDKNPFFSLDFAPTPDNIYIHDNELHILSEQTSSISLPYKVEVFHDVKP